MIFLTVRKIERNHRLNLLVQQLIQYYMSKCNLINMNEPELSVYCSLCEGIT